MEREMFYGALPDLFYKAKLLREHVTHSEKLLWERLQENQLGVRFKPQHPIDIFIADFYSHELKLIIEVDGESHAHQSDYDSGRTEELNKYGIEVIRFTNEEVINDIETVLLKIRQTIHAIKQKQHRDKESSN